jgi:uncharacterized protein YggE
MRDVADARSPSARCVTTSSRWLLLVIGLWTAPLAVAFAQEAGGSVYGQPRRPSAAITGNLAHQEPRGASTTFHIEASVLMNVSATEYLAVWGLSREGANLADTNRQLDGTVRQFQSAIERLGIRPADMFVDFISQNRVYDFTSSGSSAVEKLTGFQVKKNIAVRYRDRALLDRLLAAATRLGIHDLIKVDHVVSNVGAIRERLMEEASQIIKKKQQGYARRLGIQLRPVAVVSEIYSTFSPGDHYRQYQAYETGQVHSYGSNSQVVHQRKSRTFYYQPLSPADFDTVIHAMGVEPLVQCTLYLKVRYTPQQP